MAAGVNMSNFEVLSPSKHNELKIHTETGESFGDNIQFAETHALEFRNIQSCYPIFFSKRNNSDEFTPVALFGFEKNENLFIDNAGWNASYVPRMIQRQPFSIGFQASSEGDKKPVVSIDTSSPRISTDSGQPIFDNDGNPTEYLTRVMKKLEALHFAHEHNKGFMAALIKHELLEPFTLKIPLKDNSSNKLVGFYTIHENKLNDLDGSILAYLNANGYLQPIYMALASYSRVTGLIEKKNKKLQREWAEKLKS
jgi:hypothetical protein